MHGVAGKLAALARRRDGDPASLGALDRTLLPSARWALRRRANRAIEELNTKLKLRIQPFELTSVGS